MVTLCKRLVVLA